MKWGEVLCITVAVLLIILWEWPRLFQNQKKEKVAFLTIMGIGAVLGLLLTFFPDMPGPTQAIEAIFEPLGKILE